MSSLPAPHRSDPRTVTAALVVALVPGLAFLAWFVNGIGFDHGGERWFVLADDAMVSMTYARTLVETGEWVWFPGAERVQGFTNPLWTLYLALLHVLGLTGSAAALALILTGVLLILGGAVLTGHLVHKLMSGVRWQGAATALAVGSVPLLYPLVFWTLRGMEVGFLALLVLVMAVAALRTLQAWDGGPDRGSSLAVISVAAALGVATRLDFLLLGGAVLGLLLWWSPAKLRVLWATVPVVATTGAVLVFQRVYFGDWLPNTYHLKMDGIPLWDRLVHGVWTLGKSLPWLMLAAAGVMAVLAFVRERPTRRMALLLAATIAVSAAYHVWVGGDAWENHAFANRFLAVALPPVVILVVRGTAAWLTVGAPGGSRRVLVILGAVTVLAGGLGMASVPDRFRPEWAAVGIVAAALVIPLAAVATADFHRRRDAVLPPTMTMAAAALAVLLVSNAMPGLQQVLSGAVPENGVESQRTRAGLALAALTDEAARIAAWPAGSVAYYSRRPMIDVLGKSDRRVATMGARLTLGGVSFGIWAGHNKWDVAYSIGELKPDVVYEPWGVTQVIDEVRSYGYEPRCTADGIPLYVRDDSDLVDSDSLRLCTPEELPSPSPLRPATR